MPYRPDYLAIDLGPDCIQWGAGFRTLQSVRSIRISQAALAQIPAQDRAQALVRDTLTYIRDHEGYALPTFCVVTVPYLTSRQHAQIEQTALAMGVSFVRVIKRISAFALAVNGTGLNCGEHEQALMVQYDGAGCEVATAQIGDGVVEMLAIVQRQPAEGTPITGELLRKDIFKAIDKSQSSGIIGIYASAGLPEEYSRMLEEFFHLPCRRMPQDAVLQGGMLQAEAWTGIVRDVLMLDATDFDIRVGHEVLMEDCTTIPAELSMETRYHTARPDRCIDIYLRKNNLLLDTPLAVKLSVEPLLDLGLREQTLRVWVRVDKYQHIAFEIENPHTGQRLDYPWESIRDQLI